ncbi:hypothetical protein CASFOL_008697 [Castilleja foliolosa]|uniref:NAC domain-containing protein n=1 Tax=Castilleja foliolosa TaxID=1961234 RepID=A0ABD3E0Q3_9LAMI
MGLRDIGDNLPPGFRFYPSDEELVCHYLFKKIANEDVIRGTLMDIDLHICEPWQLPDMAKLNSNEWYFFSFRDRKYATGFRTNRATTTGYWKATGKDRVVLDPTTRGVVGMRKTLVFYKNRAPNGIKTGWIMHEFRLENPNLPPKEDWVLCRVFNKSRSDQNSNKLIIPHNLYDTSPTNTDHPHHVMPTCDHQNMTMMTSFNHNSPSHHHHHEGQNPSTSLGLSPIEHGPMNGPHHHLPSLSNLTNYPIKVVDQSAKCEDDYGFLFDFDGSNNIGAPTNLDDMGFDDDNGSVFI